MTPLIRCAVLGLSLLGAAFAASDAQAVTTFVEPDFTSEIIRGNDGTGSGGGNQAFVSYVDGITFSDGSTFDASTLTLTARQLDQSATSTEGTEYDGWLTRINCGGTSDPCNEQPTGSWVADGLAQIVVYKVGNQYVVTVYEDPIAAGTQVGFDVTDYGFKPKGLSHMSIWYALLIPGPDDPGVVPLPSSLALLLGGLGALALGRRRRRAA